MSVQVDVSVTRLGEHIEALKRQAQTVLQPWLQEIASDTTGYAKQLMSAQRAVDTGAARDSITTTLRQLNQYAFRVSIVGAAKYFKYIDGGRGAGKRMPPLEPIRQWAARQGIPVQAAFPIARAIGRRGIAARPVTGPSRQFTEQLIADRRAVLVDQIRSVNKP